MFAVVEIAGRQYKVQPHDQINVPSLAEQPGTKVRFDHVLLCADDAGVVIGRPHVDGAVVEGTIISHGKDEKVIVFKKKRRKNYRVKRGHRQKFTHVEITTIVK
jgi:large subunit ribosomal protein L21